MENHHMITRIILAVALLWAGPALAANKLYISEYGALGGASNGIPQIAAEPPLSEAVVDFSGGVTSSSPFSAQTRYMRFMCDSRCSIRVRPACTGSNATTSSKPLPADGAEYFGVQPGDCVSVIANP